MDTKIKIDGVEIEYEIVDCADKVVVLTIPMFIKEDQMKTIKKVGAHIKQTCGAKEVIYLPNYIQFKLKSIDKTIHILNKLIHKLTTDKKNLERSKNNGNTVHK